MAFAAALIPALGALGGTLGTLGTIASVAGTAISTVSAINGANYQASVARQQATIDQENAVRAENAAEINQQDSDNKTAAELGQIDADQGASGLSVNGQSQILTRKSAAELGRQDALRIRQAGAISAYNDRIGALNATDQANAASASIPVSLLSGAIGVGSDVLGGLKNGQRLAPDPTQVYGTTAVPAPIKFGQ